ncbi:unnamed protein product, partial [Ixodes persulcatus]
MQIGHRCRVDAKLERSFTQQGSAFQTNANAALLRRSSVAGVRYGDLLGASPTTQSLLKRNGFPVSPQVQRDQPRAEPLGGEALQLPVLRQGLQPEGEPATPLPHLLQRQALGAPGTCGERGCGPRLRVVPFSGVCPFARSFEATLDEAKGLWIWNPYRIYPTQMCPHPVFVPN